MMRLITTPLRRSARLLCLASTLVAPAAWADSYTDFQQASTRLEALMAAATADSDLPRLADPAVAALFAHVADAPRLFQAPVAALQDMAGPWPVNGAALRIGAAALADKAWAETTVQRLRSETAQADDLAQSAGWQLFGGCELFRTYVTPDAESAQNRLADRQIWSRIFPYSNR